MPRVIAGQDNLDDLNPNYAQAPLTRTLFLNSVPKSGSHLLKNIIRMFVPVAQHYGRDFIQYPTLKQHQGAFTANPPMLSWGHLLFGDGPSILLKDAAHILLVRDPYDWVLARARFFMSDNFQANLEHMKNGNVNMPEYLNMMIFGVFNLFPTMREIYDNNAVSWMGTSAHLIKYEDLIRHVKNLESDASKQFFAHLLGLADIELPDDWQERVRVGSDRKQSGTARENLKLEGDLVPDELPDAQKQLVDYVCPNLRSLLGYA